MGEGDRGAGSLHFFVSALRRGGCGRSGNGSHASPGEAEAEAGSLHFFVPGPRVRGGCDAAEAEAKPRPTRETVKRPFVLPDPAQRRTSPPSGAVSQAAPRSEKTAGNPAKGLSAVVVSVYQASAREGSEALNELRRYRCDPRRRGRSRAPGTGQSTESKGAPAACRGGAVTARPARQPSVALRGRFRPRWSPDCPTLRWSGRRRESLRRGL